MHCLQLVAAFALASSAQDPSASAHAALQAAGYARVEDVPRGDRAKLMAVVAHLDLDKRLDIGVVSAWSRAVHSRKSPIP